MVKRRRRTKKTTSLIDFLKIALFPPTKKNKKKAEWKIEVEEKVAREIWAVISLTVGLLITFSLIDKLGLPGIWLNSFLKPIFGWGLYIIPPLLFVASILLILSKEGKITMTKLVGASTFLVAILSIFHLSVPENLILDYAKAGTYGGYIGFSTNWLTRITLKMGNLGSSLIFIPTFLISLLLTFEISIKEMIIGLKNPINQKEPRKTSPQKTVTETPAPTSEDLTDINIITPEHLKKIIIEDNDSTNTQLNEEISIETEEDLKLHQQSLNLTPTKEEVEEEEDIILEDEYSSWEFPAFELLDSESSQVFTDTKLLKLNAEKIREKLRQFDINVQMSDVHVGPTVVQYTLKPSEGVKLSKITNLKNDLALALAAKSIRIEAPIPGKALVGIELPAEQRMTVRLKEMLESEEYQKVAEQNKLTFPLGREVNGKPIMAELSEMPHLLIAGATGAGKSVAINTFLVSLLYQNSPADLKFIMIDPKQVELRDYNGIPHLLTPVITDPEKAANALKWGVSEMNRRYQTLSHSGCRNIDEFNNDDAQTRKMPKIIVLIDELADLMMANGKEVEASICRLAQMARAVGIHLVIATQRPSVDVITGLIKANIPTRISFAVTSSIDSRTILDCMGAEDLLGKGDMLYLQKDFAKPVRVQGIYISALEIKKVTNSLKMTFEPDYKNEITEPLKKNNSSQSSEESDEDDLYGEAFNIVINHRKASASLLQRKLKIGYARAARLLDILEEKGVVGPVNGAKPREIFIEKN